MEIGIKNTDKDIVVYKNFNGLNFGLTAQLILELNFLIDDLKELYLDLEE